MQNNNFEKLILFVIQKILSNQTLGLYLDNYNDTYWEKDLSERAEER